MEKPRPPIDTTNHGPLSEKLHGAELKTAVKTYWHNVRLLHPDSQANGARPLLNTFYYDLDTLEGIDWSIPRTLTEIKTFYASTAAAFQYAHLMTEGSIVPLSELASVEDCRTLLAKLFEDPEKKHHFYESIWRPPTTFHPSRGIALQYVLRYHFGDSEAPITGVDLGAGPHVVLPSLNSSRFIEPSFPGKELILPWMDNNASIAISLGLGVDKYDKKENDTWSSVNASAWASYPTDYDAINEEIKEKHHQFPFITADLTEKSTLQKIQTALIGQGQHPEVSFVFSSFVQYQLDQSPEIQATFLNTVTSLLAEEGIWADIGQEILTAKYSLSDYSVNVYKKTAGKMKKQGEPFVIDEFGNIRATTVDYFKRKQTPVPASPYIRRVAR